MENIKSSDGIPKAKESADVLRGRFTNWLAALVYHEKINFIRKQAVQHPESSLDELIERGFQWEDPTAQVMLESIGDEFPMECEALAISYRELSPKRQEMLKLLFVDEMPPAEVAERMNCTVQHVYNRHSQALKALKAALGEGGGDL